MGVPAARLRPVGHPDYYRIRKVGVYLARQARLVTWTLDDLAAALAGGLTPALPDLRAEFAEHVAATLEHEDPDHWAGRWITKKLPTSAQPQ